MNLKKDLIKEFEDFVVSAMDAYEAQGLAVSIFGKKDTYYETFFGWRDTEQKLTMNADTLLGMASISKSFTCIALMQLAQRGVIDLEGLVSDYLPTFTGKHQKGVRITHLMSHCAGFFPEKRLPLRETAKELGLWDKLEGDIAYSVAFAEAGVKMVAGDLDSRSRLLGKPGELMSYSNEGFGLLADIVRRHGGCPTYAEYMDKHLFAPLAMKRTTMEFEAPAKDKNCTELYIKRNGKLEHSKDFYDNLMIVIGGGEIKSTVNDMKTYTRMYLNNGIMDDGTPLVDGYYINEMVKPRQFFRYQQYYGYGLATKFIGDCTVVGHGGALTGVANMFQWMPELECGVMVFCNTTDFPAAAIADAAIRLALGLSPTAQPQYTSIPWDAETIRSATGSYYYQEDDDLYEIGSENGRITLTLNGEVQDVQTARKDMILIQKPCHKADVILCKDARGTVWGIRTSGRIIPRGMRPAT